MSSVYLTRIEAFLRTNGPSSSPEMAKALGVSQPTLSRALSQASQRVLRIGRARATRYALTREIARVGHQWPLYRLDETGRAERLGVLTALHGDGYHLATHRSLPAFMYGEFSNGIFPGLPWFLDIQRPQGFLGRGFARRVAKDLGLSDDLARWQPDDILIALLRHGDDEGGDLILGEHSMRIAQSALLAPLNTIQEQQTAVYYPKLAEETLQGDIVGSSAGGEQPKFAVTLATAHGYRPVIVKFSDRIDTPSGRRWADMLHSEAIAGDILREHGIDAAGSVTLIAGDRVFLESTRFDRTSTLGRCGLIQLAALDAAYYGHGHIRWQSFAHQLEKDGWISPHDAKNLRLLGWFGDLIANNDMHLGNVGFHLSDDRPLQLAPAYDMLPMRFRPSGNGEVVPREYEVVPPLPEQRDDWHQIAPAAVKFWETVCNSPSISPVFTKIAINASEKLRAAVLRF